MKTVVIIPARYGSTRFPGKPLFVVEGRTMLERSWRIAAAVSGVEEVIVATDDERIAAHVRSFGGRAVMTSSACENGSERALDAVSKLAYRPDTVLNFQADAVLTPPWVLQALVDSMAKESTLPIATPAVQLTREEFERFAEMRSRGELSGTFVTFDLTGRALYFSKALIPTYREVSSDPPRIFRHIGLYAYRVSALEQYSALPPTPLERAEKLEQLRALEHGIPIQVVVVDYKNRSHGSIDTPADAERVSAIIRAEGELVP